MILARGQKRMQLYKLPSVFLLTRLQNEGYRTPKVMCWNRGLVFTFALSALLATLVWPRSLRADKPSWGPWEKPDAPSAVSRDPRWIGKFFRIYQRSFSSEDGATCPFYPTCSGFSYGAISKHGFLYGGLLTVDRLLSEYPSLHKSGRYPLITKHGIHRLYDPVP